MKFDYYYGQESDLFAFIRIPKLLLTHKAFASLSIQAKVLFGVLLDRMSLSMKNGWLDEEKRVYIIYQIQEIQEDLGFSKRKSMDYLNELEQIGLVEKKRRGLGLPSILYVKSFLSGIEEKAVNMPFEQQVGDPIGTPAQRLVNYAEGLTIENRSEDSSAVTSEDSLKKTTLSRSVDLRTSGSATIDPQIVGKEAKNAETVENKTANQVVRRDIHDDSAIFPSQNGNFRADDSKSLVSEASGLADSVTSRSVDLRTSRSVDSRTSRSIDLRTSRSAEIAPQEVSICAPQEVPVSTPLKNNTNINNTYSNNILSHPLLSAGETAGSEKDEIINSYRKLIQKSISYETLCQDYPQDQSLLDGIVDLMLEVAVSKSTDMVIASGTYPISLVKSKFMKLTAEHIRYVLHCFHSNTSKVANIKKYLMAALFNASTTMSGYYTAAVQHDQSW